MKKIIALLVIAVCLMCTGCSTAYAQEEYDLETLIARNDRYSESKYILKTTHDRIYVKAKKFDGRETLLTMIHSGGELELFATAVINMDEGAVKLVLINSMGEVSTIAERTAGDNNFITETKIRITNGKNIFKLVGYDCKDIEISLRYNDDPEKNNRPY